MPAALLDPPTTPTACRRPGLLIAVADHMHRTFLAERFEACGFEVWTARSGCHALKAYAARPHRVDALLLDVDLPDLPAAEFLRRARAHLPGVPCGFLVADFNGPHALRAEAVGATLFPRSLSVHRLAEELLALMPSGAASEQVRSNLSDE